MPHQVVVPKRVQKELEKIDSRYKTRILLAIKCLGDNPYIGKKLEGEYKGQRSYEIWPYRIVYEIQKTQLVVLIIRIGHRQGVY